MTMLKIGDKAPDFSAMSQNEEVVTISGLKGSRVILYFYPKDNTPGCTVEAKNLRDGKEELAKMGFRIIGISPDTVASHQKFCNRHELNFTLLSDSEKAIAMSYGVWGEKKFMGKSVVGIHRTTFVIDAEGVIERIFDKVDLKNHWQQIVESYKQ